MERKHGELMSRQRRVFIKQSAGAAAALGASQSIQSVAWAAGSDAPEKKEVRIGFIPLTDCASVVTAAVQKFADLAGKNVGVIAGTTTEARLESMLKGRLVNAKVVKIKDGSEGIAMLESGSLDAFASDKIKLLGLALQAKDPKAQYGVLLNPAREAQLTFVAGDRVVVLAEG